MFEDREHSGGKNYGSVDCPESLDESKWFDFILKVTGRMVSRKNLGNVSSGCSYTSMIRP